MRNTKLTDQERIAAVKEYLDGKSSLLSIANKYGIAKSSLRAAVSLYNSQDEDALRSPAKNTCYPPDLKRQAVEAYLAGKGSQQDICNRFHIRSRKQLQDWIKLYNGHNDFRSHRGHGSGITMTKGRKTTLDERIEIVSYCMEHGKDYQLTCQKYAVSYNQIYSNNVVAYAIGNSCNNHLAFTTLDIALEKYPYAHPLIHSDRGFQYISESFRQKLDAVGMVQSMSRRGKCIDNGPMEGFWGILKTEMYHLNTFDDYESLESAIEGFIYY